MRMRIVNLVISFLFFMTLDFARAQSVYFPSLNQEKPCPSKSPNCVAVTSCNTALRSIKKKKNPVICGWNSDVPLVCCSHQKKISSLSPKGCGRRHTSPSLFDDEVVYPLPPDDILPSGTGPRTRKRFNEARRQAPLLADTELPQYIVNGETVKEPWPWMVSIFKGSARNQLCGATLIDERHIITAAHCFSGESVDVNLYKVQVGKIDLNRKNLEYSVQEIKKHENYRSRYHYDDIAIMRLSRPIADVTPACLPAEDDVRQGDKVTVLGWGDLTFGGPRASKLQELLNIPIIQQEKCDAMYRSKSGPLPRGITNTLLCAGLEEGGKDACQYDSGGPLLQQYPDGRWTLVGVVSFGYKCAEPGYPGVYTKVSAYMKWIGNYIVSQNEKENSKVPKL